MATISEKTAEFDFKSFEYTDYSHRNYVDYVDPESNFYKDIKIDCSYYTDVKFEHKVKCIDALSIIHFNARSLNANFKNIKDSLYNPFDVVVISESWSHDGNENCFVLQGFEAIHVGRKNKRGSGVAIYIRESIDFKEISSMSLTVDNIMECVRVELQLQSRSLLYFSLFMPYILF